MCSRFLSKVSHHMRTNVPRRTRNDRKTPRRPYQFLAQLLWLISHPTRAEQHNAPSFPVLRDPSPRNHFGWSRPVIKCWLRIFIRVLSTEMPAARWVIYRNGIPTVDAFVCFLKNVHSFEKLHIGSSPKIPQTVYPKTRLFLSPRCRLFTKYDVWIQFGPFFMISGDGALFS